MEVDNKKKKRSDGLQLTTACKSKKVTVSFFFVFENINATESSFNRKF